MAWSVERRGMAGRAHHQLPTNLQANGLDCATRNGLYRAPTVDLLSWLEDKSGVSEHRGGLHRAGGDDHRAFARRPSAGLEMACMMLREASVQWVIEDRFAGRGPIGDRVGLPNRG